MCGRILSWRMNGPATSNWGRFCAFSCEAFAPVALERSSQVSRQFIQDHLPQASQLFHLLMFSAFMDWVIVYAHEIPRKRLAQRENGTTVHCELTTNFTQSTVDFLPCKVSILIYDLWSEIVTVSDTPAGSISSSCWTKYRVHYLQDVKKLRLQRFRDDRGGKNKHVFYLTKLWLMHRFSARWFLQVDGSTSVTTRTD